MHPDPTLAPDSGSTIPSDVWRELSHAATQPRIPHGLDAVWHAVTGRFTARQRRPLRALDLADRIVAAERKIDGLDDVALDEMLRVERERCRLGRARPADVHHALGLVRAAAARTLGLRPHPVQVAAALAIHEGGIAEMATGEGKTLAAAVAAVLAGWRGRGCHVLTFNGYLTARDAEAMRPLYRRCGLRVAHIEASMNPEDRRHAYAADVTYCTNQDVAADHLRDQLALRASAGLASTIFGGLIGGPEAGTGRLMMRGLDTAIIDEADSILIDEAVTPLILSGNAPNADQAEAYQTAAWVAAELATGTEYTVDQQYGEVTLTEAGRAAAARLTRVLGGIWAAPGRREELVTQAVTARELFLPDRHYVIEEGRIVIVDESTGRLMPDRTWRGGLHQAVEAKEGLELTGAKETQARISFQRFFRMYRHLGGTSGTAWEEREEFWHVYGLGVVPLPTHRPCLRVQTPDRVFADAASKWAAVLEEIQTVHATGRPILVGTRSVVGSETLSRELTGVGLEHAVLNAVRHADEAAIVAGAGAGGRITVATNMAGRGTDIKLGPGVAELGGLHVIATERHESARIDRQLFGRAARQGDPGSAVAFVSLEDDVCRHHAGAIARWFGGGSRISSVVASAQRRAAIAAARQRRMVLLADDGIDRLLGFTGRKR
ncbi:MAG: hypothetical protein HKO59_10365 [Phycisphaerales bacterium]|nr:hypothetical protein [Phycisphaerae bacterium]NNF42675.1 hypothetical protein [Phycisphaerales bacterium]NNM26366.1 hypothetical protein [Phycisphaerales bacterium]